MSEAAERFGLFQQSIANRLGVAEEVVRSLRKQHLKEGVDFRRDGNRILYSDGAVEKLRELLNVPRPAQGTLEMPSPEDSVKMVIVRRMVNPRFVLAKGPNGVTEVRVRNNQLLVPGMEMECVRQEGRWVCPRVPRRKGAW